ncbi:MAG: YraN family protein, partial [Alistipes sp.]|nr:YraN family protein [Alistipes sp.]
RLCGRNWRSGRYELDIILTHWDTLHFVEVKTRRAGGLTTPMEAMTEQKCNALRRAARAFVAQQGRTYEGYRLQFDLAAVTMYDDGRTEVEMYENVVEFGW